jgi:FAD/FMN-containing dehydrogenase
VALGKKSRAIRGGGGNFGVVTQFEFKLHGVGAEILAGLIVFPFHQAKQVLTQYREFVECRRAYPSPRVADSEGGY